MDFIRRAFQNEPAYAVSGTVGLIDALIVLAVSFGLPVDPAQKTAIDGAVTVILMMAGFILTGGIVRSQVTPVATVERLQADARSSQVSSPTR